jgi:hypothetical protein
MQIFELLQSVGVDGCKRLSVGAPSCLREAAELQVTMNSVSESPVGVGGTSGVGSWRAWGSGVKRLICLNPCTPSLDTTEPIARGTTIIEYQPREAK